MTDKIIDRYMEKIELLGVDLLDQQRPVVNELRRLARSLGLEFGWHYLLDLTWIISQLGSVKGLRLMDAGAGTGVLQWYLAQAGAEVISVDRDSRAYLPMRFRTRFKVRGLRKSDLASFNQTVQHNFRRKASLSVKAASQARDVIGLFHRPNGPGRVFIYNQNLANLVDVPDNSLDAIVSVSALEHNPPENLGRVVDELMRTLKPGGVLLATLCAGKERDWWHGPSSGWCYKTETLRQLFCLPEDAPSNEGEYDELFAGLRGNAELRDGLAGFYFQSDKNGMPWGVWDPQYLPVGVCKVKKA